MAHVWHVGPGLTSCSRTVAKNARQISTPANGEKQLRTMYYYVVAVHLHRVSYLLTKQEFCYINTAGIALAVRYLVAHVRDIFCIHIPTMAIWPTTISCVPAYVCIPFNA